MSTPSGTFAARMPRGTPRSPAGRRLLEGGIIGSLGVCGLFTLLITAAIAITLGRESYRFFTTHHVSVSEFLFGLQWNPVADGQRHFGVWPLICGTLAITAVAMAVAGPLGLITAIWMSEYAPRKVRGVLKPVLEILAGVPTVVLGFFAIEVITPGLQKVSPFAIDSFNALSAGIAVGILTLPIIVSLTEDALRAVPRALREGSYGLGSTRFETSVKVVFPAALSGVIAAFLLAIARCVGETMIVALAAGSAVVPLQHLTQPPLVAHVWEGTTIRVEPGDIIEHIESTRAAGAAGEFILPSTVTTARDFDLPPAIKVIGKRPQPLHERLAIPFDVRHSMQPMTGYLVQIFLGDTSNLGIEYYSSYAVAALLFLITFALTIVGHGIRLRFQQLYE